MVDEIDQKIIKFESKIQSKQNEKSILDENNILSQKYRPIIKGNDIYNIYKDDNKSFSQPKNDINNNIRISKYDTNKKSIRQSKYKENNKDINLSKYNSDKRMIKQSKNEPSKKSYLQPNYDVNNKSIRQSKYSNKERGRSSKYVPNKESKRPSKYTPNKESNRIPKYIPNKESNRIPKYIPNKESNRISKYNSDRNNVIGSRNYQVNKSIKNSKYDSQGNSISQSRYNNRDIRQSKNNPNNNDIRQSKNNKNDKNRRDVKSSRIIGRKIGADFLNDIEEKESQPKKNNLENNSFNYMPEKLGENLLEISKKGKNIISFIDIDIFLQRIAEDKKIYDNMNDDDTLLNGICIQHSIFISTNNLISKIISCFNYFYSRYLHQDNNNNKNIIDNVNKRPFIGYGNKNNKQKIDDNFNSLLFDQNLKNIPYDLIDLLILFVDLHEKYNQELMTNEIIDKIENFYKNILHIYDIRNKYENDINYSSIILKKIKNRALLKRAKLQLSIPASSKLFPIRDLLKYKIRDEENPLSFFNILEYESKDIAKELTRISYYIFSKIQPKEFFKGAFTKKNKNITSPNITEATNRFNKLSFWAIEEILSYDFGSDRAHVIEKFIDIANELINLNNFNDSMSIVSALGQIIINNLTKTWKKVSKESNNVFKNLKEILNFQDNYKNIRERIDECLQNNESYIPFLGPYNKRICFLEEYGPYTKDNSLINVDKIVLVQQILDQFYKFRLKKYEIFHSNRKELIIFQCLDPTEEDELETLASFIEPNFVLNNKKRKEKRVTKTELNIMKNYELNNDII